jgi:putative hydrolase of HD superfamily
MSQGAEDSAGLAWFLVQAGRLKTAPRTGWLDRGVPPERTESVADHTFRTALLAWVSSIGAGLDTNRIVKLALLHDLAEAITGDLPPYDRSQLPDGTNVDARRTFLNRRHVRGDARQAAKRAAESGAMAGLLAELPRAARQELQRLWTELESGTSPEARFVKQADKLETYLQSLEYLQSDPDRPMKSFAAEVQEVVDVPALAALRDVAAGVLRQVGPANDDASSSD